MDLSIVIVSYNTRELLEACLESVFAQTQGIDFEVIVVDNNSTDSTRAMLDAYPGITIILNDDNQGFAHANNQGFDRAKGQYLLMLNSDTVVVDGALQKTVSFMRSNPGARIVGCKLLNSDGTLQPSVRSFPTIWNLICETSFLYLLFPRSRIFGSYYMSYFTYDSVLRVDWISGAFLMFDRDILKRLGGLDETFFMYSEETDFCFRGARCGYDSWFFPGARIIHHRFGSTRDEAERISNVLAGQLLFLKKHFPAIRRLPMSFLIYFGAFLRIFVYALADLRLKPPRFKKARDLTQGLKRVPDKLSDNR